MNTGIKEFWNKFIILVIFLIFVIIINTGINSKIIDNVINTEKDSKSINDNNNENNKIRKGTYLPEPKQVNMNNSNPITVTIGGIKVKMTRLAQYDITGVVLDTEKYNDVVGPIDVGLAWGVLSKNNNYKGLTSYSVRNRRLAWSSSDYNWLNKMGGEAIVTKSCSNNHLVPANDNIRKKILMIKRDEYIRITGYLVKLEWKEGNTNYIWGPSSLTRTDGGNGACEIIYVQNIEFL